MIYNIVIYFVLWGIAIASLFNEKVRKMWRGEREAFKILKQKEDPNAKYIWFHAASLGLISRCGVDGIEPCSTMVLDSVSLVNTDLRKRNLLGSRNTENGDISII